MVMDENDLGGLLLWLVVHSSCFLFHRVSRSCFLFRGNLLIFTIGYAYCSRARRSTIRTNKIQQISTLKHLPLRIQCFCGIYEALI